VDLLYFYKLNVSLILCVLYNEFMMYRTDNPKDTIHDRMYVYRIPVKQQYKRKRRNKKNNNNFFKFFIFLMVLIASVFAVVNHQMKVRYISSKENTFKHNPVDINFNFSPRRQNILLMGVDVPNDVESPFKGNRSDTMLLVSIAPYGKNVNVISIPRDSKVYIAGKNKADKINHAFAFGGARLAVRTVEETFGVKINNYFAISNAGVIKMIDVLGGLPIYIEKDMKYDDYSAKLHINLKKGEHVLSGKEVEGYLRFRHDSYGDIGRIRRQQWFFNALLDRMKDPTVIVKLPELLKIIPEYIQTDLSGYDLTKYLGMAKGIDMSTIQVATIPGAPSTKGVVSYWIVDPAKTQELINKMVYRNKSDLEIKDLSIGILYKESQEIEAGALKENLIEKGAEVNIQTTNSLSRKYIVIHNLDITGDTVMELKKLIPAIRDLHTIYDPVGVHRTGRDLTIVLAD